MNYHPIDLYPQSRPTSRPELLERIYRRSLEVEKAALGREQAYDNFSQSSDTNAGNRDDN